MVGANGGQVGHAYCLIPVFINNGECSQNLIVPWIAQTHLLEKAPVDFIDDFQMPRQEGGKQRQVPLLQRFREQGVIGVGQAAAGDAPGGIPWEVLLVNQQPHELRHGNRRMGVIHLNGPMLRKFLQGDLPLFERSQHVLKRAAYEEVLLLEAQATTLVGAVIGIEHLGEGFRPHLFLDGAVVVADVKGVEVKALRGISAPETNAVAGVHLVPQNRHVVGDANGVLCRHPAGMVVALGVGIAFRMATKAHDTGLVRLG